MNISEYTYKAEKLHEIHNLDLHSLRMQYVNSNKKFDIGDFIYNVTGIIKVERISYEMFFDTPEIVYIGYRYKKVKGQLERTKDKKISSLKYNIKKIEI